jgi:hypothetical protein
MKGAKVALVCSAILAAIGVVLLIAARRGAAELPAGGAAGEP